MIGSPTLRRGKTHVRHDARLCATLGARLVASIGHVDISRAVRAWADGRDVPDAENGMRLRTAFYARGILVECWDEVTSPRSWFQGMNPLLGDVSPAHFNRQPAPDSTNDVLGAARSTRIG